MEQKLSSGLAVLDSQPPRAQRFPEIIALARKAEDYGRKGDNCLWRIGDELVKTCGAPGGRGVNNGSGDKMIAVAAELKREGLDQRFSLVYLRKLRDTAHAFSADDRQLSTIAWSVHEIASDSDTLNEMKKYAADKKKRLTTTVAKDFLVQRRHAKAKQALEDNKDDADSALRDCIDLARDAQKAASKLIGLATDADKRVPPHLATLTRREDLIAAFALARDDAARAVEAWHQLLQKVSAGAA